MQTAIFAKKRTNSDGRVFYTFLTRLTRKDGTEVTAQVRFRDPAPQPEPDACPMNIVFERPDANFTTKDIVNEETAEVVTSNTLWIKKWTQGEPYVDSSMDDFV